MHSPILGPIVALAAWTLVMLIWAIVVRVPDFGNAGIDIGSASHFVCVAKRASCISQNLFCSPAQ